MKSEGIERVDKADVLKRFVSSHLLVIGVLNVHRGDIIGQKHYLVAVELAFVFLVKRDAGDVLHQANDEVAGADERIDDVNTGICERLAEVSFQDMLNAIHHEIDDGLRRVDNAVSIGILDREVLEKALIKRVEESPVSGRHLSRFAGSAFSMASVEGLQFAEKLGPGQSAYAG